MQINDFDTTAASIIIADELERLRARISENIERNGQRASGRTQKSLRVVVTDEGGTLFGRSPFGTIETGRKAGRVPHNFISIIRQWMIDKGIKAPPIPYITNKPHKYTPQERGDNTLAYFIARKIARQGTLLYRNGGRADVYSCEIPTTLKRMRERLCELINMSYKSIKLNNENI